MKMKRVETIQDNFRLLALTCAHFQASFIKYLNKYQISHNMNSISNLRILYDWSADCIKDAQRTEFADYTECIFLGTWPQKLSKAHCIGVLTQ